MSKSDFLTDAERMKDQLGHAMCLAKWKQVSLHLPTGLNNSCYHPPLHAIPQELLTDNPSALHNTPHKKAQRKIMLKQERPQECSYCWAMEDLGNLSDRHYRSGEPWASKDFDVISNSTGDENVIPSYVEVNFNNACNLSCSYCSPQFSSTWQQEVERYGGYPTSRVHNDPSHFVGSRRPIPVREHNPYVEAFWRWWPELYPELRHFRMTGGEPLLDKNTYRVFDYVLDNPKPDLHLNVTSNFSVDDKSWNKYLDYAKKLCDGERIEHFMQYVSVDSVGKQAEYIRHGLDYDLLRSRVDEFLTEIPGRNSLTFIITMNNLSVTGLQSLLEQILLLRSQHSTTYQRVWFDTPVLRQPAWQSLQLLGESYCYKLETVLEWMQQNPDNGKFRGFKDYEIQRLRRDIDWMRQRPNEPVLQQNKADFYRFFTEADRRHNTNFLEVFPEMREFWLECRYYAEK